MTKAGGERPQFNQFRPKRKHHAVKVVRPLAFHREERSASSKSAPPNDPKDGHVPSRASQQAGAEGKDLDHPGAPLRDSPQGGAEGEKSETKGNLMAGTGFRGYGNS